ncbi:hypothetical protein [Gloeocapsopsis dulcis]|uniref:hypothetical protein n=1 Tax=Gloeocapsopsis dulcis TaxID=2859516 RepID=UPI0018C52E05|nr:hypothetical protein [Gloeocapsopsis dulcis]WNN89432.1 hypothetical protein P0S91_24900 [Gloeocapsopsis dulcis]
MYKKNRIQPTKTGLIGTVFSSLMIGIPAIPLVASAQSSQVLNPCPRIYYEEPFNSRNLVPQGCPPNEATRQTMAVPSTTAPITASDQQAGDTVAGERSPGLPGANLTPDRIVPADAPTTPALAPGETQAARPGATSAAPYYSPGLRDQTNPPVTPPLPENRSQAVAKVMPTNGNVSVRLKNNTNAILTYEAVGYTQRRVLPGGEETVLQNLPVPVTVTFTRQDDGFVEVIPLSVSEDGVLEVGLDEDANPRDRNQGVLRIQQDGQVFLN